MFPYNFSPSHFLIKCRYISLFSLDACHIFPCDVYHINLYVVKQIFLYDVHCPPHFPARCPQLSMDDVMMSHTMLTTFLHTIYTTFPHTISATLYYIRHISPYYSFFLHMPPFFICHIFPCDVYYSFLSVIKLIFLYNFRQIFGCDVRNFSTDDIPYNACHFPQMITTKFPIWYLLHFYRHYCSRHGFLHQRMNANGSDTK